MRLLTITAEPLASYPANLEILEQVEVEYETLPGWKKDISGVRFNYLLALERQQAMEFIQSITGILRIYLLKLASM